MRTDGHNTIAIELPVYRREVSAILINIGK